MLRSMTKLIRTEVPIEVPISTYQLRIISLSFNRPDTHHLLSSSFHPSHSFIHHSTHFKLISIHPSHINSIQSIQFKSLSSCFSLVHQSNWKIKRLKKINQLKKPRYQLRLSFSLKIKNTHQSAVIRKSLRKNWIAALKLILQYGVQSISNHSNLLSINLDLANPQLWLLKDYYYVVHPYISLYKLTVPQLVPFIQSALLSILDQSKQQTQKSINHTTSNSINHTTSKSINQTTSKSINHITSKSINHFTSKSINHFTSKSIKQTTSKSINHTTSKSINHTTSQHPSSIPQSKQQTYKPQKSKYKSLDTSPMPQSKQQSYGPPKKLINHTTSQDPSSIPQPNSKQLHPSIPKPKSHHHSLILQTKL